MAALMAAFTVPLWDQALRPTPRGHDMVMMALFCLAAWPALLIFNHLVMSLRLPLADDLLIAADRAVGFRWLAYAEWVARRAWATAAMNFAYHSIHIAVAACFAFHFASRQQRHAVEFAGLMLVTGVVGSLIGIFFPALAAMTMLGTAELARALPPLAGRVFVEPLMAMRSADALMLTHANLTGITALPSYHVTLGALCVHACRSRWWMWGPMAAYATLMIASTPIFGGHYLADIAAGLAFAGLMAWAWRNYMAAWLAPMRFQASSPAIL
jgi:PAP2 superfamily